MNKNNKVAVIGAGQVGATLAQRVLESNLADVVLLDIVKNLAIGKAFDLLDAAPILRHERNIIGTDDYSQIKGSDIVVITAGLARKPGMSREDLISKNAAIVKGVSENIKKFAPDAVVVVVTNPLDTMTYHAYKTLGFKPNRVFGMAGLLDSSRFIYLIANELKVPRASVETFMLGSHGDTMVPLISKTRISGRPVTELLSKDALDRIVKRTCDRGAEIVNLYGAGSAFYSPSAACYRLIDIILNNLGETIVVSSYLDGEYGLKDICMGVPCKIGARGIEKVVELEMSPDEKASFARSASAIKSSIELLSPAK